ncbi:unnamed protein product [Paramecium octaurelia]|uniref:Uncharacterized protein n=1 Tax=Paramecium octaurelia TaxID=43137 RepID=A0A8S1YE80_PAROT|nr:unnamed protein product [Paramecium octaurelia]
MQKNSLSLLITILLTLIEQVYSSCNYISTESVILSLSNPEQEIDVKLENRILNSKDNIGYGLWMKYQPFIPISDISFSGKGSASSGQFIYLLQQKETKFNLLAFYTSISDQTLTITHNVFYSFKKTTGTLVFNFEYGNYEGQWILFYYYFNLLSEQTIVGFYSLQQTISTKTQTVNDIPALVKDITHAIGGKQEMTNQLGEQLKLTQFIGRLSTVFSQGSVNIFTNLETFLLGCSIQSECSGSAYTLSSSNQAFLGQGYTSGTTSVFEYPKFVIKGWLKLQLFEKSPLVTVIFRVTINQNYEDDMEIGDKDIYLQYHQNISPESNGFQITTYSYNFPTSNRYTSTTTDTLSDFGAQYLELFIKWHYIQYEIGTSNNQGQPLFTMYFPSLLVKQQAYKWSTKIQHFTGTKMYYSVGGDKYSKTYLEGHISDMQFIQYCTTPIITLSPNCHYTCLTCDGPNSNNCLSCPLNSQRIQSVTQKICACKSKYVDIENEPICKPVSEIFPQMTEVELELQCDTPGYDVCTTEKKECSFGYFLYGGSCLQCPGYSTFTTRSVIQCSNCLFYPGAFSYSLRCIQDTVTYDYDENSSYQTVVRTERDIEFYNVVLNVNGDYELQLKEGFDISNTCKEGYFLSNENCIPCVKGCQVCQNQDICKTCSSGYVLTGDFQCTQCQGCTDCTIESEIVVCSSCATGTYLSSNGPCIPCGMNCSSCDSNGICLYCSDPTKYFQTFDGQNCQPCSITNCIYCYQYFVKNGITYTTLDINYDILELNQAQFLVGCALCQANLYYNILTQKCQDKPLTIPSTTSTDPSSGSTSGGGGGIGGGGVGGGGSTGGGGSSDQDSDCSSGLIINTAGDTKCLVSTTSKTSTQNTDCSSISNCSQCIQKYSSSITFCMLCVDGYYSAILTGQCLQCDSNCKSCIQQSEKYQDYWKWDIKAYYKYMLNSDDLHAFETYAVETVQNNFELICTSCPLGYILYKHKCIKDCDVECTECDVINGVATCIQCLETPQGFLKSQDSNGECQACPSNCGACLERTASEIAKFNPYFISSSSNLKYTKICYEKFNLDSPEGQYFNDQLLKTITFCETYNKCYYQVILVQNVYCSYYYMNQTAADLTGEALNVFKMKNIHITELFQQKYLSAVETSGLFQYLNEKVIREVVFEYTLVQKSGEVCNIPSGGQLFSKIQQNVFTVQSVNIKFIGQLYPTTITLESTLTLSNFTTITFQNIKLDTMDTQTQNSLESAIILENKALNLNLVIQDCVFTTTNSTPSIRSFYFLSQQGYSLSIINLIIDNLKVVNSEIFSFVSSSQFNPNSLTVYDLKVTNSYFLSTDLFYFEGKQSFLSLNIVMKSITITNTIFENSNFMKSQTQLDYDIGPVLIKEIELKAVTIKEKASLFNIQGAQSLKLQGLTMLDSVISSSSYLYSCNIFQLQDIYINNTGISSSTIFSNDVDYSLSYNALINAAEVSIINCTIENVNYNNQQAIIKIILLEKISALIVSIQQFTLSKSVITVNVKTTYISYQQSIIYLECQTCVLEDVEIQRGYGLPEITILNSQSLSLNRIKFTQSTLYHSKTLHQSVDCMLKYAYQNMYFYLYIGLYQNITINKLELYNSIVYNNPFIIIKAYDLMEKIQNEYISITNSNFYSNMLIITKRNTASSLISLFSEQNCKVSIDCVVFNKNHLNEYVQDLSRQSASTLLLQSQQGDVEISNTVFKNNLVTNSTDSILYIKSINVVFQKNQFSSNNILQLSILAKNLLLFENQEQIDGQSLTQVFPINSKSGNGMITANIISINKTSVNNSFSLYGGGFYLVAQVTGTITIQNSIFQNTLTSLSSSSFSSGGCLYIDAQLSELKLRIYTTTIEDSFSRIQGGGIQIVPSQQQNYVDLQNLTIINCFSIQYGFFSYVLSSLQSIYSEVHFSGISFIATKSGFMRFLSLLESPTTDDMDQIRNNNPMIKVKYGSVYMKNCSFVSTHIQFLLDFEFATNIVLKDIFILNSTILFSPLIRLSLRQQISGSILLINVNAENVEQYTDYSDAVCLISTFQQIQSLTCPGSIPQDNPIIDDYDTSLYQQQQQLCNQNDVYKIANYNFSLFEIDNLNSSHSFEVQELNFDSINCQSCQYGIFRIKGIYQLDTENILFNKIKIYNSQCGQTGCLSLISQYDQSFLRSDLLATNRRRQLQKHDYINLIQKLDHQVRIIHSKFVNNYATYGGSVFIVQLKTIIHNCLFQKNKAEIGGAIYYYSNESSMIIFESDIIENEAKIAGGLYLNKQQLQKTMQLDVFLSNNNSTLFGSDVFENPRSLTISVDGGQTFLTKVQVTQNSTTIIEKIVVTPYKILGSSEKAKYLTFPSGRQIESYEFFDQYQSEYIPYNLTFRIIALNKYNTQEKKLAGTTCTLTPTIINITSEVVVQGLIGSLSYSQAKFNESTGDYNLDDLIIYFNPTYEDDIILRLNIQCNIISIPEYDTNPPYLIKNYITNYNLQVDIKTFPCQLGEFLNSTSGGCILCDVIQNQYQVQWSAQSCSYKDDLKMKSIESSMIELRSSYWRAYYYSQTIEYCYHLTENCEGGWSPGDESCIVGHIGALCEQCDLYNVRGDGSYSLSSSYSCGSCDEIFGNVLTIFFISIWTLVSILMSVSSTVQMIEEFIIGIRLKAFGVTVVIKQASTAILIKVFTNYLQIISTISTFQLQVPSGLASIINSAGNPIESMAYSLDCFLINVSDILIIYFRIIWSLMMASSYITVFFTLGGVAILFNSIKFRFSYITTALIYVFIYLQPNLIGGLISLISYRLISDEYWIQGNVAYRYDTYQHVKWLLGFCFPLLLFFGAIMPIYLWYGVRKNLHRLDLTKVRQIWGYLYNEYKLHAYYWETIKILQKELIIIVLAYYEDHIPIKASLVFLVLFGYSFLTTAQKPYMSGDLNYLDTKSTIACAVSIILGSSIYTAQQSNLSEIVWPFYVIIGILNALFVAEMLVKIVFAYFQKLHDQIDYVKDFIKSHFPKAISRYPFLNELFESKKKKQDRIRERYNKLRVHLISQAKKILEFKRLNNLEIPGRIKTELLDSHDDQQEKHEQKFGINSINSPSMDPSDKLDFKNEDLSAKARFQKVYPEFPIHYIPQDSLKSSFHQSSG